MTGRVQEPRRRQADHAHRAEPAPARALRLPARRAPLLLRSGVALLLVTGQITMPELTTPRSPLGAAPIAARSLPSEHADARLLVPDRTPAPTTGPRVDTVGWVAAADAEAPIGRWIVRTFYPTPPSELTGYRWPIRNARITNDFGVGQPGSFVSGRKSLHDGIDISSWCGDRIFAAHDGVVLAAGRRYAGTVGWVGDLEPYRDRLDARNAWRSLAIAVVIDDGNGYRSIYLHLSRATVERGDTVRAGDLIGYEGETGYATGCHLHYAIFSPLERETFMLDPDIAERLLLPPLEIARIDPLLVLPPLKSAGITWSWGAGAPR